MPRRYTRKMPDLDCGFQYPIVLADCPHCDGQITRDEPDMPGSSKMLSCRNCGTTVSMKTLMDLRQAALDTTPKLVS